MARILLAEDDPDIRMMTARTSPQDVEIAYQGGTDDYVVKPFSPRDLLHRVEAALAQVTT